MNYEIAQRIDEYVKGKGGAKIHLLSDFADFIAAFHYISTGGEFIFKPFHIEVIEALEGLVFDEQVNLLINMPPRAGKSEIIVYFITWTYAINPQCNNIVVCYSDELVGRFSAKMRAIVESGLYRDLFGLTIAQDTNSKSLWKINGGGETRAVSIAGGITGFGAGIKGAEYGGAIFIDDPIKPTDARSETMSRNVIELFEQNIKTRRNNPQRTPIIVDMQRVGVNDLAGHIETEIEAGRLSNWQSVKIKAINDRNESFWRELYPFEALKQIEAANPYVFAAQYQQEPILAGGNVIKPEKFRHYKELPKLVYTKVFADTAFKTSTAADYSVFALCGYAQNRDCYLIKIWRGKWESPELLKTAKTIWASFNGIDYPRPRSLAIEDKASGIGLIQELRRQKIPVELLNPKVKDPANPTKYIVADKFQRVCDVLIDIEMGCFYIPHESLNIGWVKDFVKECMEFSADETHRHDDQVDAGFIYPLQERKRMFNPRF
jgi:predicted phage terminase large subunit-like protein